MLNEPQPEDNKPVHPLEQKPKRPAPQDKGPGEQSNRGILHIPVVQPRVTQVLIGINVLIFVVGYYVINLDQLEELYRWGANNKLLVLEDGQYYRLFSAMFLHFGLAHIAFNMMSLWFIGQNVERLFGHWRYLLIYILGGLCGSLLSVMFNGETVRSVGASGAVFAIFGAEMVFLYNHRKLFGKTAIDQLRQLAFIAVFNLVYGFATTLNTSGVRIDNWGHIGGFLGGVAIAWMIAPIFLLKRIENTETEFEAVDINPLNTNTQKLLAFFSGMLIVLIIATYMMRGI